MATTVASAHVGGRCAMSNRRRLNLVVYGASPKVWLSLDPSPATSPAGRFRSRHGLAHRRNRKHACDAEEPNDFVSQRSEADAQALVQQLVRVRALGTPPALSAGTAVVGHAIDRMAARRQGRWASWLFALRGRNNNCLSCC